MPCRDNAEKLPLLIERVIVHPRNPRALRILSCEISGVRRILRHERKLDVTPASLVQSDRQRRAARRVNRCDSSENSAARSCRQDHQGSATRFHYGDAGRAWQRTGCRAWIRRSRGDLTAACNGVGFLPSSRSEGPPPMPTCSAKPVHWEFVLSQGER